MSLSRNSGIGIGVALMCSAALWACSGWYGDPMHRGGYTDFLHVPPGEFAYELELAFPRQAVGRYTRAYVDPDAWGEKKVTHEQLTAVRGESDFRAAIRGVTEDRRTALLTEWKNARKISRIEPTGKLFFSADFPTEFALYLRGAQAWHGQKFKAARAGWAKLLALPADQRRYRSTWAMYMAARLDAARKEDKNALAEFRQVRLLAKKGFVDSLGLAVTSLGEEAACRARRKEWAAAMHLYLKQWQEGDPTAKMSLALMARDAMADTDEKRFAACVADASARPVVVAYLMSQCMPDARSGTTFGDSRNKPAVMKQLKRLDGALKDASVKSFVGADRLAWAMYLVGDFDQAKHYLASVPAETPASLWLESKFLFRQGKATAGAERLRQAVVAMQKQAECKPVKQLIAAQYAATRLRSGDYTRALTLLLKYDWWRSAAYLAENVLTTDELVAYVKKHYPEPVAAPADRYRQGKVGYELRALLGRRLAREGNATAARAYLSKGGLKDLDAYESALAKGRNRRLARAARAKHLMAAAELLRRAGMSMIGNELGPDGAIFGGAHSQFDASKPSLAIQAGPSSKAFKPTADEIRRVAAHVAIPNKRYHYRYKACDIAWEAAQLMPDNDPATAIVLWKAGRWIAARSPQAADRFYKALVVRCPQTALGQQADKLRWFPKTLPAEKE
jgi:hypothetical protein